MERLRGLSKAEVVRALRLTCGAERLRGGRQLPAGEGLRCALLLGEVRSDTGGDGALGVAGAARAGPEAPHGGGAQDQVRALTPAGAPAGALRKGCTAHPALAVVLRAWEQLSFVGGRHPGGCTHTCTHTCNCGHRVAGPPSLPGTQPWVAHLAGGECQRSEAFSGFIAGLTVASRDQVCAGAGVGLTWGISAR